MPLATISCLPRDQAIPMDFIALAIAVVALLLAGGSLIWAQRTSQRVLELEGRAKALESDRNSARIFTPRPLQGFDHSRAPVQEWRVSPGIEPVPAAGAQRDLLPPTAAAPTSHETPPVPGSHEVGVAQPLEFESAPDAEPFSAELVMRFYGEWCRSPRKPAQPAGLEVVPLQYSKTESGGDVGKPIFLFRDARQTAELVRFSPPDESYALALPHPDASFTPAVNYLFPQLPEEAYAGSDREQFTALSPVRLELRRDGYWCPIAQPSDQL
jgi:hypothetical protein